MHDRTPRVPSRTAFALLALAAIGCEEPADDGALPAQGVRVCQTNSQLACRCADQRMGIAPCLFDGASVGTCNCDGMPGGQPSAACSPGSRLSCGCGNGASGVSLCDGAGVLGTCTCGGGSGTGGNATGTGGGGPTGSGGVGTGTGGATGSGGVVTGTGGSGSTGSAFPAVTDFAAPGPFATEQGTGGDCTIFRPSNLGEGGVAHPIILWGNGTGTSPTTYQAVLEHWASHGFIVAAANTPNAGTGVEMLACLDWVTGESSRAGGPYEGKVNVGAVGTSGHSQGGGGSVMAAADPRITATAPLQPYTDSFGFNAASLPQQTAPMFLMSGSNDTFAPLSNQQLIFDGTPAPVFWGVLQGADHLITAIGNINGYRGPATAWLRLHLMGDETARSLFYGPSCGLCSDAMWTVDTKGIN